MTSIHSPTAARLKRSRLYSLATVARLMWCPHVVKGALKVSAVVGTVLNVVNHGEQIWTQQPIALWRVALNFMVPFCVSAYSAARNQARYSQEE